MTLQEIWLKLCSKGHCSDKGNVHSYLEVYEEILSPYRHTAKNILEVGIFKGDSMRMFCEYFAGTVYGMDCSVTPVDGLADLRPAIRDGYNVKIGDATNPADIHKYFYGMKFDVVIEDANHDLEQQLQIYATLKPYMAEGSIYIIEDIQDIDSSAVFFKVIGGEIIDRRKKKLRYDDVLVIIRT